LFFCILSSVVDFFEHWSLIASPFCTTDDAQMQQTTSCPTKMAIDKDRQKSSTER